ncbi:hypothetical protein [Parasphingorhabdus sp.]|uniref:hypothetical protein n=1 Tax=Parasphingorhabdus sp. TaxID=2709688 RepID=UPI0030013530
MLVITSLLVSGCSTSSESEVVSPIVQWHSADQIDPPHLNIEHVVELAGEGKIVLDGRTMGASKAIKAFSKIADNETLAFIDFAPACSDQSETVLKFRNIIEASGACADNFCICGGYFNSQERPLKPR